MTDLYFKAAHSSIGQSLFKALNLPKPIALKRSPDESLTLPAGRYLLAGCAKAFCMSSVLTIVHNPDESLNENGKQIDFFEGATINFLKRPKAFEQLSGIQKVSEIEADSYDALVFDASGADNFDLLASIYEFFHSAVSGLKENARILLLAQQAQQIKDPQTAAIQASLVGFCKSLAKEYGKKGISCNLVFIQKGAQKYLDTSLAFFLSAKSAYVTGQAISLSNHTLKQITALHAKPLHGKVALVTGAAQGIGKQTALTLARDGATVICLDIPEKEKLIKALASSIQGYGLPINLLSDDAVDEVCKKLSSQVGVVDIVVHNAGITRDKTLAKMSREGWDQVLTLNFERVVKLNQAFIEQAILNDHARIICISSISGIAGNFGQTNYACSKAGIAAYVEAFAHSNNLKSNNGLTINAIAPGFIETQMTQNMPFLTREVGRRMNALSQGGLPLDIAEAISYFCHPGSHCLNGNVLRVCGLSLLGK